MEKKSKYKTIVKFENGMEIKADQMSWVLYVPSPRHYSYYPSLGLVLSEILDLRIKELASQDIRHTLKSLSQAIVQANSEIKQIIETITTIKLPSQSCLGLQEGSCNTKDE